MARAYAEAARMDEAQQIFDEMQNSFSLIFVGNRFKIIIVGLKLFRDSGFKTYYYEFCNSEYL